MKRLCDITPITEKEKKKILIDFNDTAVDYPRDKCVHQLFEEQVERTPDKVAVVACDKTLTYAELNEQANRIAHSLVERDIGIGDIVALKLTRKSYLLSAILGTLKSGAAYLPVDPDYPQDRIDYMLADSHAKLFITEDNIQELLAADDVSNPHVDMSSNDLCYCIYTSGSTGKPKGTVLKHQCVVNYVNNNNNNVVHKIIKSDYKRVISVTTIGFDIFVTESLLPLANGLEILLTNEEQSKLQIKLNDLLLNCPADVLQTTPTKMKSLIVDKENLDYLKTLKAIILGGEAVDEALVSELYSYTDAKIFNIYGPTETTVWSTNTEVIDVKDITIGKPIANTQIYIVDKHMHPTPIGVTGELCIAGDGVGAGYLNRPELTAEKFVDNPFGEGKLYKTGDLAYWREDGNVVYVGRNDFQVKIRGLRIELGEIENAICGIDGISQAVVVVRKNSEGRQLICAFYTGEEIEAKEIRAHIGKKLPKYMLPHIFAHLNEMPLTSSGKVNRKALPEVDLYAIDAAVEYVAPTTEKEEILVSSIEATLGIDKVGIMDNFFDIGGDSLKAIELISKLEKQGYHTDTKTIFECDTVKELAEQLTAAERFDEVFDYSGDIPATDAQMRVYTAQSMHSDSTTYNVPYAFWAESVDPEKLQHAVDSLITRHESLRTHFENKDGHIIQVINDAVQCPVEQLATDNIAAFIRPFDLGQAPLLRVGYYKNTVMIDMHHIITDGSSMPIFLRELNELYMGRELTNAPVQYKQFAIQKRDCGDSEKYWLSVFEGEVPVLELNTDIKRGQKQSVNGSAIYDKVGINLHRQILAKCKQLNITPYVFYMGAFNILLSKFSGSEDIVVGMPISGRDAKYLDAIGMFVNTIALRNEPTDTIAIKDFLENVKENSVNAIAHQNYPYGELVKKLNINAQGRNPLFDVLFAYQSEQMTDVMFGDEKAELLPIPVTTSKYDFTFNILPRDSAVVLMVEYCADLYKRSSICRLTESYKHILQQMLREETLISEVNAVTVQEQQQLLVNFNDTATEYPKDKCVHQLFEDWARKTPERVAVIACDRTMTYEELNVEANRIAHALIEKGVIPGDIVAFSLSRESHLIAAMFGILKAGAAYLPIDPNYPSDRIEYMLSDSNAKFFITENTVGALISSKNTDSPDVIVSGDGLCYCIYTSGSTGKPKAVAISHTNVHNFVLSNAGEFQSSIVNKCDYVLATNAIVFDITVQDILLPLLNGLTVMLSESDNLVHIGQLVSCAPEGRTGLIITPTKLRMYMQSEEFCANLHRFSVIMVGAENFPGSLYDDLRTYTNALIYNGYGPTETTCGVLYAQIDNGDNITIGKPISNTQIYIVDKNMKPTPIGVSGELCIAGDGVGAGYLNRPELTAEKFVDNPFGEGKLYKTGDLAYWREDGNVVYVGRNDFQVKIRGLRIELGEIENAICGIDGISQAVVVVRKNQKGRQLICAFYAGKEVDAKEIRTQIGMKLPKYMLPHIFTHLNEMPLTSSGKVNRKALPEVDIEQLGLEPEYIAPKTNIQKELCKLFEETLEVTPVGVADNFFDLGGDSLKAIEFVAKAHSEGIYFDLQNVFEYPTVETLSECIEKGDQQSISYTDADFREIKKLLAKNTIENISVPIRNDVGNILLAGATGFLGIHILADFLDHDTGTAYCLVRGKNKNDSTRRMEELLQFYFGGKYAHMHRIEIICADLQKELFGLSQQEYTDLFSKVNMVINAAASVKHYGSYQYFYEANVETTKRLIDYCKESGAKLIHTSTVSISGNGLFDGYSSQEEKHFYESSLYIGQSLDNVYARSKFEAEKAVLEAVTNGLQANIMRMGNLTNRLSDGVFQQNHESNAFLQRMKAVLDLGVFPDYLMSLYSEFTPIDEAANAVMTIARHFQSRHTVFHINSTKVLYMEQQLEYFLKLGFQMKIVDGDTFTESLRKSAQQSGMEYIFETFINDMDENDQLNYDSNIRIENDFTVRYLKTLGFEWSDLGFDYLKKYVAYFKAIGYLEDKC